MSKTQTPTLAELRELREWMYSQAPAYIDEKLKPGVTKQFNRHLATIDALIAAHPDTEGEKRG